MRQSLVRVKTRKNNPVEIIQVSPAPGWLPPYMAGFKKFLDFYVAFDKAYEQHCKEALADKMKKLLETSCENM